MQDLLLQPDSFLVGEIEHAPDGCFHFFVNLRRKIATLRVPERPGERLELSLCFLGCAPEAI
jgi:hypothetical protein